MSQQVVAALCAYRGGMIPGIKSAVNVAFKTIPALKPFQDLKKKILELPKKIDVKCISFDSDLKNPLALIEIVKRPKTQKAVIKFLMSVKSTGAEKAEEAINKMKEIAEGIILTLVPEDKIKTIINDINIATKKDPAYNDLLSIMQDAQDPKFDENIKQVVKKIENDLNNSLKKMNSLNSEDLIKGVQDPNHITRKCGLTVPKKIQEKIDAYKNAVGDAQSQVANAQGALNNPQAAALAAAQKNPAAAAAMGKAANAQGALKMRYSSTKKSSIRIFTQTNLQKQIKVGTNTVNSQQKHIERMKKAQELRKKSKGTFGGKKKTKKKKNKLRKRKSRKKKFKRKTKKRKRKLRKKTRKKR